MGATKNDDEVMCVYCFCMAGLGEACSHIAALLFAAQTNIELKSQFTCTSLSCSQSFQSVPFAEITQIDFSSPVQKSKCLMKTTEPDSSFSASEVQQTEKRTPLVSKLNEEDKYASLKELYNLEAALYFITDC